MEQDSLKLKKETVVIEGGRKLYNYTFDDEQDNVAKAHVENHETTPGEPGQGKLEGSV
jgi:hypothetical protein